MTTGTQSPVQDQTQHGRNLVVIYAALMLAILLAALDQTTAELASAETASG